MKAYLLISPFLLAAALPAGAFPFTGRSVTGGFSHADNWSAYSRDAVCADFAGNGQRQWYFGGETIKAFPGTLTRSLPAISLASHPSATPTPLCHTLLDVDRDGDQDIVRVVDWKTSHLLTLQVYLNQGGGTYTLGYRRDWAENPGYGYDSHVMQIAAGDFDRDGATDLAVLTMYFLYDSSQISYWARGYPSIWWNDGTGQLDTTTNLDGRGYSRNSNLVVEDVDHDGDLDLVCTDWSYKDSNDVWHQFVRSYTNDGAGAFAISSVGRTVWNGGLYDVNRDGWSDLIAIDTSGPVVALNDRAGTFPTGTNIGASATAEYAIGDVDEDGIPDMICAGAGSATTVVFRKGTGTGSFQAAQTLYTLSSNIAGLAVADAEPDGDMDIMVQTANGGFVLLENRSPHRSPAGGTVSTVSLAGVTQLTTGDFNRDGLEDVLAVTPSQKKVWFFNGEADGLPAAPVFKLTQNEAPAQVAVADFNRDGREDFAYTLPGPGEVRQVLNNGNVAPTLWPDTSIAAIPGVS
ncbi:MAG TPA: VCBS repeat-containing protein, partial [Verrucomicrobiales bacterium]|nr:VCBS repeat-containing protein [Verrucomicrobiales bacterium]